MPGLNKKVDWEEVGRSIAEAVVNAVDYWCTEVSGEDSLACFESHAGMSLYDLAVEFLGESYGISEKDLELLRQMPKDVYDKFDEYVGRRLERIVRVLRVEYREVCFDVCRDECGRDGKCIDECMKECMGGGWV
jgi:hypothetical protein